MGITNICGFEHGDTLELEASGGTAGISTAYAHAGTYSWRVYPTTTATGYARLQGISSTTGARATINQATCYMRIYFLYVTKPAANEEQIMTCRSSSAVKGEIRLTSSGTLKLFDSTAAQIGSTGTTALEPYRWYRIEWYMTTSATPSTSTVYVDGAEEITGSGTFTNNNVGDYDFGKPTNLNGQTVDFYYDDYAISDSANPGEGFIVAVPVNGAGSSSQWTGSYTDIDDTPPNDGDATYIYDGTASGGKVSLFTISNPGNYGVRGTIKAVRVGSVIREELAHTSAMATRLRSAGTNSTSGNRNITASYGFQHVLAATDPAGGNWTYDRLKAIEVGVVNNGTTANNVLCTYMQVLVEFAPIPAPGVIVSRAAWGRAERIEARWASDDGGAAWSEWFDATGMLDRIIAVPDSTYAPSANYDVTLERPDGVDALLGLGANRSAANVECAWIYRETTAGDVERNVLGGRYRVKIANAGANKCGVVAFVLAT